MAEAEFKNAVIRLANIIDELDKKKRTK